MRSESEGRFDISVVLPSDRQMVGELTVGMSVEMPIAGLADLANGRVNPRTGVYDLMRIEYLDEADEDVRAALGDAIIYFKSIDGDLPMAIHAGYLGEDGKLLPTEGTLRVSNVDLDILIELLEGRSARLTVTEQDVGLLGRMFRSKVSSYQAPRYSRRYATSQSAPQQSDDSSFWFWMWLLSSSREPDPQQDLPDMVTEGGQFDGGGAEARAVELPDEPPAVPAEPEETRAEAETPPVIADPFTVGAAAAAVAQATEAESSAPAAVAADVESPPEPASEAPAAAPESASEPSGVQTDTSGSDAPAASDSPATAY